MIEVNHNGHEIRYNEDDNIWECRKMRLSGPSLSGLKTQLNEEDREDRRINSVPAFHVGRHGEPDEVILTMVDTTGRGANGYIKDEAGKKRQYFSFQTLVLLTDKTKAKIERYRAARDGYAKAEKELESARQALPTAKREDFVKC